MYILLLARSRWECSIIRINWLSTEFYPLIVVKSCCISIYEHKWTAMMIATVFSFSDIYSVKATERRLLEEGLPEGLLFLVAMVWKINLIKVSRFKWPGLTLATKFTKILQNILLLWCQSLHLSKFYALIYFNHVLRISILNYRLCFTF